jgi:hypothetical protein
MQGPLPPALHLKLPSVGCASTILHVGRKDAKALRGKHGTLEGGLAAGTLHRQVETLPRSKYEEWANESASDSGPKGGGLMDGPAVPSSAAEWRSHLPDSPSTRLGSECVAGFRAPVCLACIPPWLRVPAFSKAPASHLLPSQRRTIFTSQCHYYGRADGIRSDRAAAALRRVRRQCTIHSPGRPEFSQCVPS